MWQTSDRPVEPQMHAGNGGRAKLIELVDLRQRAGHVGGKHAAHLRPRKGENHVVEGALPAVAEYDAARGARVARHLFYGLPEMDRHAVICEPLSHVLTVQLAQRDRRHAYVVRRGVGQKTVDEHLSSRRE